MTIYALSSGPGISGVAVIRIGAGSEIEVNKNPNQSSGGGKLRKNDREC